MSFRGFLHRGCEYLPHVSSNLPQSPNCRVVTDLVGASPESG